jgi:HSP20 family protein
MRSLAGINRLADSSFFMNDLLSEFFKEEFKPMTKTKPASNIYQTETAFGIDLLLPGYAKEEISVDMDGRNLIVKSLDAENKVNDSAKATYLRRDFKKQAFEVKFILPKISDFDKLEARFDLGVLKISIPKAEQALPKKIKVEIA